MSVAMMLLEMQRTHEPEVAGFTLDGRHIGKLDRFIGQAQRVAVRAQRQFEGVTIEVDVFGPVVNIASRLTSLARPSRVLVARELSKVLKPMDDEFRVRLAQTSVLGSDTRRPNAPQNPLAIYPTPYDLFTVYREEFSPTAYEMLTIPVATLSVLVAASTARACAKTPSPRAGSQTVP